MIVSDIKAHATGSGRRVEATIEWEDSDRPTEILFYETGPDHLAPIGADPNAFLVATLLPAWNKGERRVRIEDALCPMLVDQLQAPLSTFASWYEDLGEPPAIEFAGLQPGRPGGDRGVSLLSLGIDSLSTLRANRMWLPPEHPLAIRSLLLVDFLGRDDPEGGYTANPDAGKLGAAGRVAADVGAGLMSVRTNLWWLDDDGWFFTKSSFGALFLSAAHTLSGSFAHAYIAASIDARHPSVPAGSSPLIDPYYSSSRLQVQHHGTYMTRLQKTALVADWPVGLDNIRVCVHDVRSTGNCGTCEKCIRTMLMLVALGKLDSSAAFEEDDVDDGLLQTVIEYKMIWVSNLRDAYLEIVPSLEQRGRRDLVDGINAIAADFDRRAAEGDPDIVVG